MSLTHLPYLVLLTSLMIIPSADAGVCDALKREAFTWRVKLANPGKISTRTNPIRKNETQFVLNPVAITHDAKNEFQTISGENNLYTAAFRELKLRGITVIDLSDPSQVKVVSDMIFYQQRLKKYQFALARYNRILTNDPKRSLSEILKNLESSYLPNSAEVRNLKPTTQLTEEELQHINEIMRFDREGQHSALWNEKPIVTPKSPGIPTLSTANGIGNLVALDRHRIEAAHYVKMPIVVEISRLSTRN